MLDGRLARFVLLPELKLLSHRASDNMAVYEAEKIRATQEICPRCATPSKSVYDRRKVKVRDEPIRRAQVVLIIHKRRYYCHTCRKPFTEPVPGIMPRRRTTQRLRRAVVWACDHFTDLKKVRSYFRLSSHFIYKALYDQLDLKLREVQYPWPKVLGIDEHFYSRAKGYAEFATILTDMKNKRPKDLVQGKTHKQLWEQLEHVPGRENVERVVLDLSDTYRSFVRGFFPNAELVADKFHVLRLLSPHIIRRLKEVGGLKAGKKGLLLRSRQRLSFEERSDLNRFLVPYPELRELYSFKERLHGFYRVRGYDRAKRALELMREEMKNSTLPEVQRLGRTLKRWEKEVLAYFKTGLTNARTEGFNNVAKLVQKRAYGYKRFENYRRRFLTACF